MSIGKFEDVCIDRTRFAGYVIFEFLIDRCGVGAEGSEVRCCCLRLHKFGDGGGGSHSASKARLVMDD